MVNRLQHIRVRMAHWANTGLASPGIVKKLAKEGIKLSERTCRDWLQRMHKDEARFVAGRRRKRTGNVSANRQGRPPLTAHERSRAIDFAVHHPKTGYGDCARQLKSLGIYISKSRLAELCLDSGYHSLHQERKIMLTPNHKRKRRGFASSHIDFPWSLVAFADSKTFLVGGSHNPQNERYRAKSKADVPPSERQKSLVSVKFFGVITLNGRLPLIPVGHQKAHDFQRMMQGVIPQIDAKIGPESFFLHDNAPEVSCPDSQEFLQENCSNFFSSAEYPARSPDFNAIENQWAEMDRLLHEEKCRTKNELIATVERLWIKVNTPDRLQALYDSMPERMKKCMEVKGDMTGY
jgi:hypothetical protein